MKNEIFRGPAENDLSGDALKDLRTAKHISHVSSPEQLIMQLDKLQKTSYTGPVIIDDECIPQSNGALREFLIHIIAWQESMGHPFTFYARAVKKFINLQDLRCMMNDCGLVPL
jgi:hypothetical protein